MQVLFRGFRSGDFHTVRAFVRDLMSKIPADKYGYYDCMAFFGQAGIGECYQDIAGLEKVSSMPDRAKKPSYFEGDGFKDINVHPTAWRGDLDSRNISWDLVYEGFKNCYRTLGLPIMPLEDSVAWIDFSRCKISALETHINQRDISKIVFISNGPVFSLQAPAGDMSAFVVNLATRHPDITFYISAPLSRPCPSNVFLVDSFVSAPNLNECAYVGSRSQVIIGRCSGPFTFAHTRETLIDEKKAFVSFNYGKAVAAWYSKRKSKVFWANEYSAEQMLALSEKAIGEFIV